MTNRQPTLSEVAKLAGVSVGTVSRVINNAPHVSRKARDVVERAIEEFGYVPNVAARSLASQRSGAVVLAISSDDPALFANLFFAQVISGVNAVIEESDLELMLVLAASERGRSRLSKILQSRAAAGVMLLALRENDPLTKIAEGSGVPVVHGGRSLDVDPPWYVDADNRGGARQAVEYLISAGRTRFATITGPQDMHAGVARYLGYREAMALAGLSDQRVVHSDFTEDGGRAAMAHLLAEHPDLDAVMVASDIMAAGALVLLKERGIDVPEQVAVVSASTTSSPPSTPSPRSPPSASRSRRSAAR
ncbi:hypothetical protein GCM10022419_114570 [Nonomuraea rosea]|uniref:HTH lacI-type domain-containing protein n=1 Tax=Nonomuraea rosea TaxID=638574 RepID=A0ABP6ZIB2_9ACTN